jgi:hypothetical protein
MLLTDEIGSIPEPTEAQLAAQKVARIKVAAKAELLGSLLPTAQPEGDDKRSMEMLVADPSCLELPARNTTPSGGYVLEAGREMVAAATKAAQRKRRNAAWRAKQKRASVVEETLAARIEIDPTRLDLAWQITVQMIDIIISVVKAKAAHTGRILGDGIRSDLHMEVLEKFTIMLAKSDHDLPAIRAAAADLKARHECGTIPVDYGEYKDRRWLMQVVNVMARNVIADAYRDPDNAVSHDRIDSVLDVVFSGLSDPGLDHHKAQSPPASTGTRIGQPGVVDPTVIAWIITTRITEQGLDQVTEAILDALRSDGLADWAGLAASLGLSSKDGKVIRTHVRKSYQFLLDLVPTIYRAIGNGEYIAPEGVTYDRDQVKVAIAIYAKALMAEEGVEEEQPTEPVTVPAPRPVLRTPSQDTMAAKRADLMAQAQKNITVKAVAHTCTIVKWGEPIRFIPSGRTREGAKFCTKCGTRLS